MRRLTAILLAPFLALSVANAQADSGRGVTGSEVMSVLKAMDLKPTLLKDHVGDPRIQFIIKGLHAYVHFYDCDGPRCGSLQLEVGLDLDRGTSLQVVNVFNSRYRYGRASLDDEMDPFLHYDFEVLHTSHTAHIRSQVELFGNILDDFTQAVGFR